MSYTDPYEAGDMIDFIYKNGKKSDRVAYAFLDKNVSCMIEPGRLWGDENPESVHFYMDDGESQVRFKITKKAIEELAERVAHFRSQMQMPWEETEWGVMEQEYENYKKEQRGY